MKKNMKKILFISLLSIGLISFSFYFGFWCLHPELSKMALFLSKWYLAVIGATCFTVIRFCK